MDDPRQPDDVEEQWTDEENAMDVEEDQLQPSSYAAAIEHEKPSPVQDEGKKSVNRSARACTVCRTAKMRCIGGDDQGSDTRPCNRCKKSGVPCVFEQHRRGRKPGSKLSDAAKAARRAEKLHTQTQQPAASSSGQSRAGPSTSSAPGPSRRRSDDVVPSPSSSTYLPYPPIETRINPEDRTDDPEEALDRIMDRNVRELGPPHSPHYPYPGHQPSHPHPQVHPSSQPPLPPSTFPPHTPSGVVPAWGVGTHPSLPRQPPPGRMYMPPPPLQSTPSSSSLLPPTPRVRHPPSPRTFPAPVPRRSTLTDLPPLHTIFGSPSPSRRPSMSQPQSATEPGESEVYPSQMLAREKLKFLDLVLNADEPGGSRRGSVAPAPRPSEASGGGSGHVYAAFPQVESSRSPPLAPPPAPLPPTAGPSTSSPRKRTRRDSGSPEPPVKGKGKAPKRAKHAQQPPIEPTPAPAPPLQKGKKTDREKRNVKMESTPPRMTDAGKPYLGLEVLPSPFHTLRPILEDPIELNLLTHAEATDLLAQVVAHLNPFVNLFDPELHTVDYIRSRSKFLFTVLMCAGCKWFKPELFVPLRRMAAVFCLRSFDVQEKSVETVQAYCCMVYWKDPDDNRTWMFVGLACRMAVEIGLNLCRQPQAGESRLDELERRNKERTYFVLFVHDRSLSMQTGRMWMLQEDDLVRNSTDWHKETSNAPRPEDVIVAAFVQLRRLSAETSDVFYLKKNSPSGVSEIHFQSLLAVSNATLSNWMEHWEAEMKTANGNEFHHALLHFFRLHVRLFLNSLGLTKEARDGSEADATFSITALGLCYSSAEETLRIVLRFNEMGVLRYGQDVITVMSAYASIFLLRLTRRQLTNLQGGLGTAEIRALIEQTAAAFYEGAVKDGGSPSASSAAAHARFLYNLVRSDREDERRRMEVEAAKQAVEASEASSQPTVAGGGSSSTLAPSGSSGLFVSDHAIYYSDHTYIHPEPSSQSEEPTSSPEHPVIDSSSRPRNLSVSTAPTGPRPPMTAFTSSDTVFQTPHTQTSGSGGPGPSNPASASSYHPSNPFTGSGPPTSGFGSYQQGFTHVPPQVTTDEYGRTVPIANPPLYLPPHLIPPSGPNPHVLFQSVQNDPDIDPQYTMHMYEQLGIPSVEGPATAPQYAAPAAHPYFPNVGDTFTQSQY